VKVADALKCAYLSHEVDNICLVISQEEADEFLRTWEQAQMYRARPNDPMPRPIPGRLWGQVYGVNVWIKER
jgi:hypothetical protein